MERNFTNENFEGFLKQNADRHRMRASDKVWKNISKSLNKKRRYTVGLTGFFLLTSLLGYLVTHEPRQQFQKQSTSPKTNSASSIATNTPPALRNNQLGLPGIIKQPKQNLIAQQKSNHSLIIAELGTALRHNSEQEMANPVFDFQPAVIDSDPESPQTSTEKKQEFKLSESELLTIESVLNSYKRGKKKKLGFQFYFTPTVSYRKLSENKSYLRSINNVPANYPVLQNDVNNIVTHKPDMGFEVGFTGKYALTNKLKLRAGVQLNVNRYAIKAFSSATEIATIALNNSAGSRPDSVLRFSSYNNFNGYKTNWLQNYYLQVSAPVGLEYTFAGNKNIRFGVASTIQPTYLLGDRAYMISSDYKNYVEVPWLVRKWNVNTNLETFVSYSTGKMNWQVGPQVRYQLLSSFISKYPVKENLFDFGLKVGVSLNK
jgi:hypothetical protein